MTKATKHAYPSLFLRNDAAKEAIRDQARSMGVPMTEWAERAIAIMDEYLRSHHGPLMVEPKTIRAYAVDQRPNSDLVLICATALKSDPGLAEPVTRLLSR